MSILVYRMVNIEGIPEESVYPERGIKQYLASSEQEVWSEYKSMGTYFEDVEAAEKFIDDLGVDKFYGVGLEVIRDNTPPKNKKIIKEKKGEYDEVRIYRYVTESGKPIGHGWGQYFEGDKKKQYYISGTLYDGCLSDWIDGPSNSAMKFKNTAAAIKYIDGQDWGFKTGIENVETFPIEGNESGMEGFYFVEKFSTDGKRIGAYVYGIENHTVLWTFEKDRALTFSFKEAELITQLVQDTGWVNQKDISNWE